MPTVGGGALREDEQLRVLTEVRAAAHNVSDRGLARGVGLAIDLCTRVSPDLSRRKAYKDALQRLEESANQGDVAHLALRDEGALREDGHINLCE